MKALTATILVVLLGLTAAAPAAAGGIEQGTVELVTNTGFSYSSYSEDGDGVSVTNLRLGGSVGYFFTSLSELQVALLVDHTSIDIDGGGSASVTNTGMAVHYIANFATESAIVPFIGAGAGVLAHGGDVGNADAASFIMPRILGGIRFLVGNSASVNLALSYEHQTNALGVEDVSGNVIMLDVGVSAFVQGGRSE